MSMLYSPEEKRIFKYHDGNSEVFGDPERIHRRIVHFCGGDPDKLLEQRWAGIPEEGELDEEGNPAKVDMAKEPLRFAATEALIEASRAAFDMEPYDKKTGKGAGDGLCLDALDRFIEWLGALKKSAEVTRTLPSVPAGHPGSLSLMSAGSEHGLTSSGMSFPAP